MRGQRLVRWPAVITACCDALVRSLNCVPQRCDVRLKKQDKDLVARGFLVCYSPLARADAYATLRLRLLDAARRFELEPDYNLHFETIPRKRSGQVSIECCELWEKNRGATARRMGLKWGRGAVRRRDDPPS